MPLGQIEHPASTINSEPSQAIETSVVDLRRLNHGFATLEPKKFSIARPTSTPLLLQGRRDPDKPFEAGSTCRFRRGLGDDGEVADDMKCRVGAVVHDFNNSLQAIVSVLDLLQQRVDSGKLGDLDRLMSIAFDSTEKAHLHMRKMASYISSPGTGSESVDVNAILKASEHLWRAVLGENVSLVLKLAPEALLIACDPQEFESLLLNLVVNSRDAMPEGGSLKIETLAVNGLPGPDKSRRHVGIQVADTGEGMSPACAARACNPFYTTKGSKNGSGLGLWSVKQFVDKLDGELAIESIESVGTAIRIRLPRAR